MTKNQTDSNHLDNLPARDIVALYLGYRKLLHDLQDYQLSGKRLVGGFSTRIQIASLHHMHLEDELRGLARRDPDKLRDIQDYLRLSLDQGNTDLVRRIEGWLEAER